uniref:4-hydroxythreonine-4-phosphate dehydrogenase n=1 Tax=uncultured Nitrospirae bacterium MY3-5B TaxID=798578 RepID=D9MP16_9BACT|nr:4-hydroxythreonine-4-phosphate dehydrogenase [uncultured Nitrospirae bacterium MY3-5B]
METRKKILITIGDPAGIGPEVALKAFLQFHDKAIVFVGDADVLSEAAALLKLNLAIRAVDSVSEAIFDKGILNIIDVGALRGLSWQKCVPTAIGGRASAQFIRCAVEIILNGGAEALVTAPISKEALMLGGVYYLGHTEMLAELSGATDYAMMLTGGRLRVILATIHTAIRNVPDMITLGRILGVIRHANTAAYMLGIIAPRIAVAGLNPHAGEAGMFGREEIEEIAPAIEAAALEGISVTGPHPPDTIFHKAYNGEVDIVVCMYHDQGLIPLKMIAFDRGVNMTIGLPFIRTSPDHGTAYDIAWQGRASATSMAEAIKMASTLRLPTWR